MENVKMKMEYSYPKENKLSNISLYNFVKKEKEGYTSSDLFKSYEFTDYTTLTGKK